MPTAQYLNTITPIDGEAETDPIKMNGVDYRHPVKLYPTTCGLSYAQFNVDGKYQRLLATAGLGEADDDPSITWRFEVTVVETNAVLFDQDISYGHPVPMNIAIGGVQRLQLSIAPVGDMGLSCGPESGYWALFGDARLAT